MNYRKVLLILAILLLLPFALKVRGEVDTFFFENIDGEPDTMIIRNDTIIYWSSDSVETWNDPNDWLPAPSPSPTFIVYKVDTVECEIGYDSVYHRERLPAGTTLVWWESIPFLKPKIDTTIIGRFTTDADATDITKWRVREE